MTSTITCRAAFGRKYNRLDASTLVSAIKEGIVLVGGFGLTDFYPSKKLFQLISFMKGKLRKIDEKVDSALQNIINKHMSETLVSSESGEDEQETEDLVDVLLRIQKGGSLDIPITIDDIKAVVCVSIYLMLLCSLSDASCTYVLCQML